MKKKILVFDRYGKFIRRFDSVEEIKAEVKVTNLYRCLFRETVQSNGIIVAFEDDERLDENGNLKVVDYIVQYDDSGTLQVGTYSTPEECPKIERAAPHYLLPEKKFDTIPRKIECWYKTKKIGVFDNVAEARRITGSSCIWANLLGECKTTNDFVFRFAA